MEIRYYTAIDKGCMRGRFNIYFKNWGGLEIRECVLFEKNGSRWITLPNRAFDGKDGKKAYSPLVKFDQEAFTRLQSKVLELIEPLVGVSLLSEPVDFNDEELPF